MMSDREGMQKALYYLAASLERGWLGREEGRWIAQYLPNAWLAICATVIAAGANHSEGLAASYVVKGLQSLNYRKEESQ